MYLISKAVLERSRSSRTSTNPKSSFVLSIFYRRDDREFKIDPLRQFYLPIYHNIRPSSRDFLLTLVYSGPRPPPSPSSLGLVLPSLCGARDYDPPDLGPRGLRVLCRFRPKTLESESPVLTAGERERNERESGVARTPET